MLRVAKCYACSLIAIMAIAISGCSSKESYSKDPAGSLLRDAVLTSLSPVTVPAATFFAARNRLSRIGDTPYTEDMPGLKFFDKDFAAGQYYETDLVKCEDSFTNIKKDMYYIFNGNSFYKTCYSTESVCTDREYKKQGKNVFWMEYWEYRDSIDQFVRGSEGERYNVFEVKYSDKKQNQGQISYVFVSKLGSDCYKKAIVKFSD